MVLAPISWGDEVRPDSVWSFEHLGYSPIVGYASIMLVVLSRDGSRRIMTAPQAGVSNPDIRPTDVHDLSRPDKSFQGWAGMKLYAELQRADPGQKIILLQFPVGEDHIPHHKLPGMYLPYGVIGPQTRMVSEPVNPIGGARRVRDAISPIAAGWDVVWHSRYVFQDHLRQQVTGRLVDGLLANIERGLQALLTNSRPAENSYWKAKLAAIEVEAKAVCGVCTGDPYVWARTLARNIDLDEFRLRFDQGQVPAMNLTTKPWQPGATVAAATYPPNTDVNAKKELTARWHDSNQKVVEDALLKWHDEVFLDDTEPSLEPAEDHFHGK